MVSSVIFMRAKRYRLRSNYGVFSYLELLSAVTFRAGHFIHGMPARSCFCGPGPTTVNGGRPDGTRTSVQQKRTAGVSDP